jgi:hypothetical protein
MSGPNAGAYTLTLDGPTLTIEAQGQKAFATLNSVRDAEPGRLERLSRLMDSIMAANRKGDFAPLFKAYGGRVPKETLKEHWAEAMHEIEDARGPIQRYEILGTARTQDRDETVVRFHCERGKSDLTYVWDLDHEGRLLGVSRRGLTVRQLLYPSGEHQFFTWDGGIRPPKIITIDAVTPAEGGVAAAAAEPVAQRRLGLRIGESKEVAVRDLRRP